VNDTPISLRRRQVLIAGVVSAAAPAASLAGECAGWAAAPAGSPITASGPLIVSGRIIGADCRPLAHTRIDITGATQRTSATTDGDGRFMVSTQAHAGQRELAYRISGERVQRLALRDAVRDESGAWRTTFSAALA
jgi:hypothetical protein